MKGFSAIHDKAQPRPSFSEGDAARLAREIYSVAGSVKELTSERDQNFHIEADSGRQFVLKIAAAAERKETLEFQNAVMALLGERVRSGFIPQLRKTQSGDDIATVAGENHSSHFVRPLTYHPSALLAKINPHTPELLHSLGHFLGEIDKALDGFTHPAARREMKWDLQGALWIKEYTHHIATPERRDRRALHSRVRGARHSARCQLAVFGSSQRRERLQRAGER